MAGHGSENQSMDESELQSNPFLALFPTQEHAKQYISATQEVSTSLSKEKYKNLNHNEIGNDGVQNTTENQSSNKNSEIGSREQITNDLLQRIFLITINADPDYCGIVSAGGVAPRSIFLRDLHSEVTDNDIHIILTLDNIHQAIMERLTMSQPKSNLVISNGVRGISLSTELEAIESLSVKYLCQCYKRVLEEEIFIERRITENSTMVHLSEIVKECKSLILSYAGTVLISPEAFPTNEPHRQLFNYSIQSPDGHVCHSLLQGLVHAHTDDNDLGAIFSPMLDQLYEREKNVTLMQKEIAPILEILLFYAKQPALAKVLVNHPRWLPSTSGAQLLGSAFEKQTIIGRLLSLSSVSSTPDKTSEYFADPSRQSQGELDAVMSNIRRQLNIIVEKITEILHSLLQNQILQHHILFWIGLCLDKNSKRAQLYSRFSSAMSGLQASDGFFLNLTYVLLRLAMPITKPKSKVILKVDPRYCAAKTRIPTNAKEKPKVYVWGLSEETAMNPKPETEPAVEIGDISFRFVTHCFFMVHKCLHVGLVKVFDGYHSLMKQLQQLSDVYREARLMNGNDSAIEPMKNDFERGIKRQLSLKAHLLNPDFMDLVFSFCSGSSYWLIQQFLIAQDSDDEPKHRDVLLPLSSEVSSVLKLIPEMLPENIADCLIWLGHFSEETFERAADNLDTIMDYFSVFLGCSSRIHNPHLRAKHAEALAAFLPRPKASEPSILSFSYRKRAFEANGVCSELLPRSLLQLFVDIEFTGHSMEFEQKFGYRHHMYAILEYIWSLPAYFESFRALVKESEEMAKQSQLSVFPRFVNLLVNDSTFLLDEAMDYLSKIRELEADKSNGQWKDLPPAERKEKEATLKQYYSFARGYNIMANETVHSLSYITKDITTPFARPCMVTRMAGFLNYFLLHLVGPKRRKLKVQDFEKLHFKPKELVCNIIQIVLNMCKEECFCHAVASDERSYSEELYVQAEKVLVQINKPYSLIEDLRRVALKFKEYAAEYKENDDSSGEAPDEFLDPLLGTLMFNPVLLPSSGTIVDRHTIARHLLSDSNDPFNRSPLSLDMVKPQDELRDRIEKWAKERNIKIPKNCI